MRQLQGTMIVALGMVVCTVAQAAEPQIPQCKSRKGTVSIVEPDNKWWGSQNLESPELLIKVFVSQSKCFTILDRGKGMTAAQRERELAGGGDFRVGSNVGKGQMKAADYVLVPDLISKNEKASGSELKGLVGGLLPKVNDKHGIAAGIGGIDFKTKTANVALTLTDVRSSEQVAFAQGQASKTNVGWNGAGLGFAGLLVAGGASSYSNTEIGRVIATAYLKAFTDLVAEVNTMQHDVKADNVNQSVTMTKPGRMYVDPDIKATVVRDLEPGAMLYPTGEKQDVYWKVSDELGNEGWVPSTLFQLAK
jgi:curli biogenesis system outer membrane secretion channel CsgG